MFGQGLVVLEDKLHTRNPVGKCQTCGHSCGQCFRECTLF